MNFQDVKKQKDLYAHAVLRGSRWYAQYRVPWAVRVLMCSKTKRPKEFDTKWDAYEASVMAMCHELRNKATGWQSGPVISPARQEAEALFKAK